MNNSSKPFTASRRRALGLKAVLMGTAMLASALPATAQFTPTDAADLKLASNSPFRNPDIIYLEADRVFDNRELGILTADGAVEARYQDRTLRADKVIYNLKTGRVIATGNVVLVDGSGASQFANKIELTDQLASGSAKDFTARFNPQGIMGAAYAVRRSDEGIDLYNAYYTACEPCQVEGKAKTPSWRIKARKVTQDKEDKMIHYRDAVVEIKGLPILYLPYLAHPDPETERRSGFLIPYGGRSGGYGFFYEQPYYWAISDYSEATITPRIMERVNPLIEADYTRQFHSGRLEVEGSFTYGEFFDNRGDGFSDADFFADPSTSLRGEKWRSHLFARGQFDLTDKWMWGFGLQTATDDLYLDRYDIDEPDIDFGLYDGESRRLVQQLYAVGQDDNYRYSMAGYGFQSLRTVVLRDPANLNRILVGREEDSRLPVVLPKIELDHYFDTRILGGRVHAFGDAAFIRRAFDGPATPTTLNDDYDRISAGVDWSRTMILPGGIEVKPFAMVRHDDYSITSLQNPDTEVALSRTIHQGGVDARWTFVRPGETVDWTLEPRVQAIYSGGDRTDLVLLALAEDSIGIDLDKALLWENNKSTGYDFFQRGTRVDTGVTLGADWNKSRASVFLGQSFSSGEDLAYDTTSGLRDDRSDIIGEVELSLAGRFDSRTRLRYDDDENEFRRIDTSVSYTGDRIRFNTRYYKINDPFNAALNTILSVPPEEISGYVQYKMTKDWSVRYQAARDIDAGLTRREELAFIFNDDCTYMELFYEKNRNELGINGNSAGFGVRIALLTLGDFTPE